MIPRNEVGFVNELFQSVRQTLKHALAIVLFTLLLFGMMGAALGIFSAGISVLTHHRNLATTVPALATPSSGSAATISPAPAVTQQGQGYESGSASNPQAIQGNHDAPSTSRSQGLSESVPTAKTGQDLAGRLSQQLRNMQSPVTGRLDSGGVALGNQVQNMFGRFLSGLLQTLFVEQANGGATSVEGSGTAQGTSGVQGPGTSQGSAFGQGTGTN